MLPLKDFQNQKLFGSYHHKRMEKKLTKTFHMNSMCKTKSSNSKGDYTYCNFRKMDYENFIVGLLMPAASRRAYFAIRAFNIETANIKELAKNIEAAR